MITKSNQHIRRLFEGSCYTKDWSNDGDYCESQHCITEINDILKKII